MRTRALAVGVLAMGIAWLAASLSAPATVAQSPNQAGVVISSGQGEIEERCVAFDEDTITGVELLERSGLDTEVDRSSLGTAICMIDGRGCSSDDCFCEYPAFWGYWTLDDREWAFSQIGASQRTVRDGAVDGWSWGENGEPAPPVRTITDICGAGTAGTPTATSVTAPPEATPASSDPTPATTAAGIAGSTPVPTTTRSSAPTPTAEAGDEGVALDETSGGDGFSALEVVGFLAVFAAAGGAGFFVRRRRT